MWIFSLDSVHAAWLRVFPKLYINIRFNYLYFVFFVACRDMYVITGKQENLFFVSNLRNFITVNQQRYRNNVHSKVQKRCWGCMVGRSLLSPTLSFPWTVGLSRQRRFLEIRVGAMHYCLLKVYDL